MQSGELYVKKSVALEKRLEPGKECRDIGDVLKDVAEDNEIEGCQIRQDVVASMAKIEPI
jgi:hypothetical protein